MAVANALIHTFTPDAPPYYDDDGDQMLGSYFQFIDENDEPVSPMIGPYGDHGQAARAAQKAFDRKDFC